ncbi:MULTISPECIES: hypothetical protein [Vibrio harveyi group]|uniref:hypothetical protein n=1 Tax=Vibrio harveyi group TaxID=717610 RepID=UPI001E364AC5|nr:MULTISPECIES: hypothetical protein [Vibrio harveyi group]MCC8255287.1 hypothetical protein [Vibrio campbellii CAIM 333]WJT09544.1 hypothetical protein PH545_26430 [Vibrio harveyi]
MCNAHNHTQPCFCGWGQGRNTSFSSSSGYKPESKTAYTLASSIEPRYKSFVNPNALCPVCKQVVFFYQSPYGGRVFFDDLGKPWQKHPCTDNSWRTVFVPEPEQIKPVKYDKGKFSPMLINHVKPLNKVLSVLDVDHDGKLFKLYMPTQRLKYKGVSKHSLVMAKVKSLDEKGRTYLLSILDDRGKPFELTATNYR